MSTRTVRLDDEAERELARLRELTGLSISEVLKRGLLAYRDVALEKPARKPFEIYEKLDLGEGRYARVPASRAKTLVTEDIREKHRR